MLGKRFWRFWARAFRVRLAMRKTLPAQSKSGNTLAPKARSWRELCATQALIWGVLGGAALVLFLSGFEVFVAKVVHQPDIDTWWGRTAWELREWGAAIPTYIALAALTTLCWPVLAHRRPLLYRSAVVMVFAAVFGAGLINQVMLQELTDRHRPRETILLGKEPHQLPAELDGHSFPSGHAGIAFVLAAPFFVLRRAKPKLAKQVLVGGLAIGAVVGLGRMGLGAHYASDVLVAGAISLSVAALTAWWLEHRQPKGFSIPRRWLATGAVLACLALLLGNAFKVTMTMTLPEPMPRLNLPCVVEAAPDATVTQPTLVVHLKGFGAPVSNLKLREEAGEVRIAKGFGVFHSLRCKAELKLPVGNE